MICGLDVPWAYPIMQPVVEPKDGVKSISEIMGDLADRKGMTANYVGLMNMVYRVMMNTLFPWISALRPRGVREFRCQEPRRRGA